MAKPAYQRRAWGRLCAQAWAIYGPTCWLCHRPIDRNLPATDRWSGTIDHMDPVKRYGPDVPTIMRVRPAHRSCNSARRNQGNTRRWVAPDPVDYGPGPVTAHAS